AGNRLVRHPPGKELMASPALSLGAIEREVGAPDQLFLIAAVFRCTSDPDRRADVDRRPGDRERSAQIGDKPVRDPGERLARSRLVPYQCEFIAPEAADRTDSVRAFLQPFCNLAQQVVTNSVSQRVVDELEPVEIDEQQRAAALPSKIAEER